MEILKSKRKTFLILLNDFVRASPEQSIKPYDVHNLI
jgi:hypothetical protein